MISYTERTPVCNHKIYVPEPNIDADLAARLIAARFGLALHVAALVAALAGLGGGRQ
jgi:hypothetical protein